MATNFRDITMSVSSAMKTITNKVESNVLKASDKRIVKMKTEDIQTKEELSSVYAVDEKLKNKLVESMKCNGFDKSHPIHVFRLDGKWIVCDGHTRLMAAKEAGLPFVYAQIHDYESMAEAKKKTITEQVLRRQITEAEQLAQFEALSASDENFSAEELAEKLHKSRAHIFKLKKVESKATEEQLNAIKEGKASINQVFNEIEKQKAPAKKNRDNPYMVGAKYALLQIQKGRMIHEIVNDPMLSDSAKAKEIIFTDSDEKLLGKEEGNTNGTELA